MARHAQELTVTELLKVIQAFNQAATETRSSWQPALPLEMAFIEAISLDELSQANKSSPVSPAAPPSSPSPAANKPASAPGSIKEAHTAPAEAREMSPEDAITNQRLDKSWNLVLAQLRNQNPSLYGLVNSVKSRALKGNTLTLGLRGDALKSRLEDPANLALLH